MSHDTVILKIIGGTLHEMLGGGDLVIPRGMERISDSGYRCNQGCPVLGHPLFYRFLPTV